MTIEDGRFEFRDPKGKTVKYFDKLYKKISESRREFDKISTSENRTVKDMDLARERYARVVLGSSFRPTKGGTRLFSPPSDFKLRVHDGRDWPSLTTKEGSGSASGVLLDPHELGTYFESDGHASGKKKLRT